MKQIKSRKIAKVISLMILVGLFGVFVFGSFALDSAKERDLFISAGNYTAANSYDSLSGIYEEFAYFSKALTLVGVMLLLLNLAQLAITKIDFMDAVSNPRVMTGFMQMLGLLAIAIAIIMTFSYSAKSKETSPLGVNMVKQFEGLRTNAYLDAVGVPTIGYGITRNIKLGMKINEKYAEILLSRDLFRFENYLNRKILKPLTTNEFDALVSFVYNIGSLRGNMARAVRIGDPKQITYWMNKYVRAGGRVLRGLVIRRKIESEVYDRNCRTIKRYDRCFSC